MFAGAGGQAKVGVRAFSFDGSAVVDAVLRALFTSLVPQNAATADSFTIVGGAGVVARVDELAALLLDSKRAATGNASSALSVLAVCDGSCLLLPDVPAFAPPDALCLTDANCPPLLALPALHAFSGGLARPGWCISPDAWRCYTAPLLLPWLARAATPTLLVAPQYDETALRSFGIDYSRMGAEALDWTQREYAPTVRKATGTAPFAFSPACGRSATALSPAWFRTTVPRTESNLSSAPPRGSLAAALVQLALAARGGASFGAWRDDCAQLDGCNPSCADGREVKR